MEHRGCSLSALIEGSVEIEPHSRGSQLRVFLDCSLPDTIPARLLGYLLAGYYAAWCTKRIVEDAEAHFK